MFQAWIRESSDSWLRLLGPIETWTANRPDDVRAALVEVEAATRAGRWAVGWLAYEAARGLNPDLRTHDADDFPVLGFALFDRPERLRRPPEPPERQPLFQGAAEIDYPVYAAALRSIKERIAEGATYQVNFTYRMRGSAGGRPEDWRARALGEPNGAYLETDEWAMASLSPELLFRLEGDRIQTRPMKGTAPRGRTLEEDRAGAEALRQCPKNRAENLMIVDMMRNDLGRIARTGSVRVDRLFDLERYPTVWQMTSTVSARTDRTVVDLLAALFPSASVTGAPKVQTMRIVRELEASPRRIYTGSIGWIAPGRSAQFNVAIRTLLFDKRRDRAEYGVGGGVVWDSTPEGEWAESAWKARVVQRDDRPFALLETLGRGPGGRWKLLEGHLDRMAASAEFLGFSFDREEARRLLAGVPSDVGAVRLLLHGDGRLEGQARPVARGRRTAVVVWARDPIDPDEPWLYHKTTRRTRYEQARASAPEADDVLLWNLRGEATESTIANLLVRIDGRWWTPPVACGLLPGVARRALLARGRVRERALTRREVEEAEDVLLVNSVRGAWRVSISSRPVESRV